MSRLDLPGSVRALIRQQVEEPREERLIAASLPRLTPIDDAVSRAVRAQYEDHPYPRWQGRARLAGASAERVLTGLFPHLAARAIAWPDSPAILVAGCGTGHHSIATAQRFANCRVTAVDLSLASLAYASRKTREAGLENIDYAQADILGLGALTQRFDMIESAGVLHHMADPLAGWRVLRGLLAPGGFMKIGLYSERGRRSIVAARTVVEESGLAADAEGIRAGRDALGALPVSHPARQVVERPDFFSMSTCRDMIFHVQEHRFDLPGIAAMIAGLGLEFVGFELASRASARAYRARFPDDPAMLSLANWDAFEADHPGTFAGMFLFWVRDPGAHPGAHHGAVRGL
jgi:SAM-dependent methyltransferase